jgi:hypothetical protein
MAGSRANAWLASGAVTERGADAEVLGLALGALVATLVVGPADARAARPDWPAERWSAWAGVRDLVVGGGLVAGELGRPMVEVAREWLSHSGIGTRVILAERPETLTLRGVASLLSVTDGIALDCGGSWVKRAVVPSSGDLPAVRAPAIGSDAETVVRLVADAVLAAGSGLNRSAFRPPGPGLVAVALATYVDADGQPYAGQLGPYAALGEIDLVPVLREAIEERIGHAVDVRVVHDGWAALLGARLEHPPTDAVIVLGTAIGSGVDPVGTPRRP